MAKKLSQILRGVDTEAITGSQDIVISDVCADSRLVTSGALFVAVKGVSVDGHKFISDVIAKGATAFVCQDLPQELNDGVTYIKVANSAIALGFIASNWYDNPSQKLHLVGVTGTNGKTTIATTLYEMARLQGEKAGLLSTVVNYVDTRAVEAKQTTPDVLTINRLLHEMVEEGCTFAAMEVSSHACDQHRIAGLKFVGGIFTNLTRDHLDYHKTVDEYLRAKKSFFDSLPADAWALTNIDDKTGKVMLQNTAARKLGYSLRSMTDFNCKIIESHINGMLLSLNGTEIEVLFTGKFNAYNLAAVYGASLLIGWDKEDVDVNMSRLVPVSGRFQTLHNEHDVTAVVDYAHTPDAIANVLNAVREVLGKDKKIITVVGAGGCRDHGKRPLMAQEAAKGSDRVILTSDNPRTEDPASILAMMADGLTDEQRATTLQILDRREAIRTAVALAQPGDVVAILGKGHENYQEINGVRNHFDDREVASEALGISNPNK
jgi:UDP-N-acetylmuramoyl-L-alanyl-D-glutamate--2,6-diaminopimelate ligase